MTNKEVCILMSVHLRPYGKAGELYLRQAIESNLCQTDRYFRFLIVIDGSDNNAERVISSYADERIEVIWKGENTGLTDSLNRGLREINEPFILRMDADDISHPQRLEKLIVPMRQHDSIGAIGDNYGVIDDMNRLYHINTADPSKLAIEKLAGTIAGGGALLRTEAVKKVGGWKYKYAQDFYMWVALRKAGYKIISLEETLYYYRQHRGQISVRVKAEQNACGREIRENEIRKPKRHSCLF